MSLSEMFTLIKRADYYVKIPRFLKYVKIADVPYDDIMGAISRTLIRTNELANQNKEIEWADFILNTDSVKHEQFLLMVTSPP